jgi:hypothetical protein
MRKCSIEVNETLSLMDLICDNELLLNLKHSSAMIQECDCPIECEYSGYNYKLSVSEYPTKRYADYLLAKNENIRSKLANASYEKLRQSISKIRIFYDEMVHTVISEDVKIEVADFVASVGGILSLFLGLSFLTLVELFEIMIKIAIIIFKQKNG